MPTSRVVEPSTVLYSLSPKTVSEFSRASKLAGVQSAHVLLKEGAYETLMCCPLHSSRSYVRILALDAKLSPAFTTETRNINR
jgi:hypothetical protein